MLVELDDAAQAKRQEMRAMDEQILELQNKATKQRDLEGTRVLY